MKCTLVAEAFDDPEWIFEPKLDGLRVLVRFDGQQVELLSRNDKPQNFPFPDVVESVRRGLSGPAVLDGEICCLGEDGQSSFRALQQRFHLANQREVERRAAKHPAYLFAFDILWFNGHDVRDQPLEQRAKLLRKALHRNRHVRIVEGKPRYGRKLLDAACARRSEGIIGKRLGSRYVGHRISDWIKLKCLGRQEFVIGGFTDPQRSRVGLGAILVGYYDRDRQFNYAGKVGTGFTNDVLRDLRQRLEKLETKTSPFDRRSPRAAGVHWTQPKLVAEIAFGEWTQNDLLRQPRFAGLREDKKPEEVVRERAKHASEVTA